MGRGVVHARALGPPPPPRGGCSAFIFFDVALVSTMHLLARRVASFSGDLRDSEIGGRRNGHLAQEGRGRGASSRPEARGAWDFLFKFAYLGMQFRYTTSKSKSKI